MTLALLPARSATAAAALLVIAAAVTPTPGVTVSLASDDRAPSLSSPSVRADVLGLPAPAMTRSSAADHCAIDILGVYPSVCFGSPQDTTDYVQGTPQDDTGATQALTLSGYGGTPATTSYATVLGVTCTTSACGTTTFWYSSSGSNCTHAYPANDYYANNVSAFTYAENFARGTGNLNCNRLAMYRDGTQGGAGAISCSSTVTCGGAGISYESISWHNG